MLIPSGLTTEGLQGEAEFLHYKKMGQQNMLMSKLTSQIRNRQKYAEYQNEKNLAYENSQIDQCLKSIDQLNLQQ